MAALGEQLKQAREKKRISIKKVEFETKIKGTYIQALEEENFVILPDKQHIEDILKVYAAYLGLDHSKILAAFRKIWVDSNTAKNFIKETYSLNNGTKAKGFSIKTKITMAAAALALVALIVIGFNFLQSPVASIDKELPKEASAQHGEKSAPAPAAVADLDAAGSEEKAAGEVAPEDKDTAEDKAAITVEAEDNTGKIQIEITAVRGDCWLEVRVDGESVFYRTMLKGEETQIFEGIDEVEVLFGNAAAVDVILNGNNLGLLGDEGQVVRKVFQ